MKREKSNVRMANEPAAPKRKLKPLRMKGGRIVDEAGREVKDPARKGK